MSRTWANGTAGGTPLSADRLNGIEKDLQRAAKTWQPGTLYAQGEVTISPSGGLYTARQSHTSGQVFSDTMWKLSEAFAPALPDGATASRYLRGDWTWQPIEGGGGSSDAGFPVEAAFDPANVAGPVGSKVLIPTPQNSVDGEACHPSVLFFPEGWNGFKYWMAFTPYPGGNDDHEDPCIVASQDGITWVVPPGQVNPIDDADGQPSYNSDTDLKMGPDGVMYLFWRYFNVNQVGYEENLYYSTSTDGVTWAPKKLFWQSDKTLLSLVSPSMIFEDGRWTMYAVDIVTSPNRVVRVVNTGADPEMYWGEVETLTTGAPTAGKEPWHLYVIKFGGRYYMLRADCTLDQNGSAPNLQFQVSADGKTFVGSGTEVIPQKQTGLHDQLYRATLVPAISGGRFGFRVWYTGWTTSPQKWWLFRTFISEGAWKNVPLNTAAKWAAYVGSGGYYQGGLRYKRVGDLVTLEGTVKSGTAGSVIATLPAEALPASTFFPVVNAGGNVSMLQLFGKDAATADLGAMKYFTGAAAPSYLPINITYQAA